MAKAHSTQSTPQNDEPSIESIFRMMGHYMECFSDQIDEVQALAVGGEAWAGKVGYDGDEIDVTSRLMFGIIREKVENASNYHALKNTIAKLRARLIPEVAIGEA